MSKGKIIGLVIVIAFLVLVVAMISTCHGGSEEPHLDDTELVDTALLPAS